MKYNPLHVQVSPGSFCVMLWELGLKELVREDADYMATAVAVSNEVLYLQPRSLNISCPEGVVSDLDKFQVE